MGSGRAEQPPGTHRLPPRAREAVEQHAPLAGRLAGGEALAQQRQHQFVRKQLAAAGPRLNWGFLGAPGVGKGTYASRVAKLLGVPHVSAGDLVRDEIKAGSELAKEVRGAAASAAVCSARAPARRRCPRSA